MSGLIDGFHIEMISPTKVRIPKPKKTFNGLHLKSHPLIGTGNNARYLIHGNGCDDWTNCFTCPKGPDECNFHTYGGFHRNDNNGEEL